MAERLHSTDQTCITADLGIIHQHHFAELAKDAPIPIEIHAEEGTLNPVEKLLDHVAGGKNPERIPEEQIAKGFLYAPLLRVFNRDHDATINALARLSVPDIRQLFKAIRAHLNDFHVTIHRWANHHFGRG